MTFWYYDRNYEAKFLLLREQDLMPQIAIGIRDMVGTRNIWLRVFSCLQANWQALI